MSLATVAERRASGHVLRIITMDTDRANPTKAATQDRVFGAFGRRVIDYLPDGIFPGTQTTGLFIPAPPRYRVPTKSMEDPGKQFIMQDSDDFHIPRTMVDFEPGFMALAKQLDRAAHLHIEAVSIASAWEKSETLWGAAEGVPGLRVVKRVSYTEGNPAFDHERVRTILKEEGSSFVVIPVDIFLKAEEEPAKTEGGGGSVENSAGHANAIIFDKARKRVVMFDPHVCHSSIQWDADGHHNLQHHDILEVLKEEPGTVRLVDANLEGRVEDHDGWVVERIAPEEGGYLLQMHDSYCQSWTPFLASLILLNPHLTVTQILSRVCMPQYELMRFLAATHIWYTRRFASLPGPSYWRYQMEKVEENAWQGDEMGKPFVLVARRKKEREAEGDSGTSSATYMTCTLDSDNDPQWFCAQKGPGDVLNMFKNSTMLLGAPENTAYQLLFLTKVHPKYTGAKIPMMATVLDYKDPFTPSALTEFCSAALAKFKDLHHSFTTMTHDHRMDIKQAEEDAKRHIAAYNEILDDNKVKGSEEVKGAVRVVWVEGAKEKALEEDVALKEARERKEKSVEGIKKWWDYYFPDYGFRSIVHRGIKANAFISYGPSYMGKREVLAEYLVDMPALETDKAAYQDALTYKEVKALVFGEE